MKSSCGNILALSFIAALAACGTEQSNSRSTQQSTPSSDDAKRDKPLSVEEVVWRFEQGDDLAPQEASAEEQQAWQDSLVPLDQMNPNGALAATSFSLQGLGLDGEREVIDLRTFDTGIRNQGSEGTCTAFATVAALENITKRTYKKEVDLSERFHWNNYADYQVDSSLEKASRYAIVPEAFWPYNARKASGDSSKAGVVKLKDFNTTTLSMNPVLQSLRAGRPVVIGVGVSNTMMNPAAGGIVKAGRAQGRMGHALPITGAIIDSRVPGGGYFIIKNSWGLSWGDRGYGYLAFNYCDMTWCSAWSVGDVQMFENGVPVTPPTPDQPTPVDPTPEEPTDPVDPVPPAPVDPAPSDPAPRQFKESDFSVHVVQTNRRGLLGARFYYISLEAADQDALNAVARIVYRGPNGTFTVRNSATGDASSDDLSTQDFKTWNRSIRTGITTVILKSGEQLELRSVSSNLN